MNVELTSEISPLFLQPYSAEALGQGHKPILVADELYFDGLPRSFDLVKPMPHRIKESHKSASTDRSSTVYGPLHKIFLGNLEDILGPDLFDASRVYFDHCFAQLRPGAQVTFTLPHLDGTAPGGINYPALFTMGESGEALKLVATACDTVPTIAYQGPTRRGDYGGDPRTHLRRSAEAELRKEEFPVGNLVFAPVSLTHAGQVAEQYVERNFLRWQVMIDL